MCLWINLSHHSFTHYYEFIWKLTSRFSEMKKNNALGELGKNTGCPKKKFTMFWEAITPPKMALGTKEHSLCFRSIQVIWWWAASPILSKHWSMNDWPPPKNSYNSNHKYKYKYVYLCLIVVVTFLMLALKVVIGGTLSTMRDKNL